jgi:DNA-binding CsgD family transcriptional regulator
MHHEEVLGRDEQWSRVADLLAEVASGDSAALLVDGAPGTGRTTLLRAAAQEATRQAVKMIAIDDVDELPKDRRSTLFTTTGRPTAWLLTGRGDVRDLTSMTDMPIHRTTLGPLPQSAVDHLVADRLGSTVDPAVQALIAGAGGNPLLLTELLDGLRDEGMAAAGTPRRVQELVRRRARPEAWQLLRVGAVLGRSCEVADLAAMMRQSTAELLPTVDTLLDDGVLDWVGETLSFRHELVWWAVLDAIPLPVRRALTDDRDRIRAASPDEWHHARPLAGTEPRSGRRPPAGAALPADDLDHVHPRAGPHPDHRPAGRCHSAPFADDDLSRSVAAVREALARPSPLRHGASLYGMLANLLLLKGDGAAAKVAADRVLATPGVGERLADGATAARLVALALTGDPHVEEAAEAMLAGSAAGSTAAVAASFVLSNVWWDKGQLDDALRMARHRVDATTAPHWWLWQRLALTNKLAQLRRLDEATAMSRATHTALAELKLQRYEGNVAIVESHVLLLGGRLSAAAERAKAGIAATRRVGISLLAPFGFSVLAAVALRGADLDTAAARLGECADDPVGVLRTWVSLQLAARQHGPAHAAALAVDMARDSLLVAEPGAAAWLVRTATAAGDTDLARQFVARAERLAAANPGFPTLSAAATQARGHLVKEEPAEPTQGPAWESLSDVERAIAALVAKGMTNRQIATRVRLSPHTVNYHLRGMFRKLAISSRAELARHVPAA